MSKRSTSNQMPTAANVDFPVFLPGEDGSTKLELGKARLRSGTLVVEFKDTAAGFLIQKMIERGVLLGMAMILLQPDELNQKYQDKIEVEELRDKLDPTIWERYSKGEIDYEEAVRLGGELAEPEKAEETTLQGAKPTFQIIDEVPNGLG